MWKGIGPPHGAQCTGIRLRCAFILQVRVGMHFRTYYRGMKHGGTSRLVRYIEVYVIASCVIASQFSMQLMLFRRGLSVIVRNSEVYVISRVIISRFDL